MNTITFSEDYFDFMNVLIDLEFTAIKGKPFTYRLREGSVSNGCDVTVKFVQFHSEYGYNDFINIEGKKWVWDGDDVEFNNEFNVTIPAWTAEQTLKLLI